MTFYKNAKENQIDNISILKKLWIFLSRNKPLIIVTLFLSFINFFIFTTPIKISLQTDQLFLLVCYLALFVGATTAPAFISLWFIKKKVVLLLFVFILIGLPIVGIGLNNYLIKYDSSNLVVPEESTGDFYLDIEDFSDVEALKDLDFCFRNKIPTYYPEGKTSFGPYELKFVQGSRLIAKECAHQLTVINYNPCCLTIYQVSKKYDFDFNKGNLGSNIQSLQDYALSGNRLKLKEHYVYDGTIPEKQDRNRIFYWETEDSLIFFNFSTQYFSESEYIKIAESLTPIK